MDYYNQTTDIFFETPVVYAGFWERVGATLIDFVILIVGQVLIVYLLPQTLASLINLVITWLYYALLESGESQATIGKRAVGLKVTDMNGGRISFGQATGRHFGKFLSGIILLIGYLMMLWDDKKQTLHDKMAGTLVVKN